MTPPNPLDACIIAVDVPDMQQARELFNLCRGDFNFYKIGLQLFLAEGHSIVELFKDAGKKVFLDLKLHDIPATVNKAAEAVRHLEPDLLTVHASGGAEMVHAAVAGSSDATGILAVTVLTSIDNDTCTAIYGDNALSVTAKLIGQVAETGAYGFVSSVWEARALKKLWPEGRAVTPGIRLAGGAVQDQKRVATPDCALAHGADHLVIGRAVTAALNYDLAVQQLTDALRKD